MPVILGSGGVEKIVELNLTREEKEDFGKSVSAVSLLVEKLQI